MTTKILYKYTRADGGITVSLTKPENTNYSESFRIIADENKLVTKNGIDTFTCFDTDSTDGWYEVDIPEDVEEAVETEPVEKSAQVE